MGGLGSGCWERENNKITAPECYSIDVNALVKDREFHVGDVFSLQWSDRLRRCTFVVTFSTFMARGKRILLLFYDIDSQEVTIPIQLQTTSMHFGGVRWWFTCPLLVQGKRCNRRVGKLYLPPGARYFGCRHCHDVVFRRKRDLLEQADLWIKVLFKRLERAKAKHGW